jgi:hypothetical protein
VRWPPLPALDGPAAPAPPDDEPADDAPPVGNAPPFCTSPVVSQADTANPAHTSSADTRHAAILFMMNEVRPRSPKRLATPQQCCRRWKAVFTREKKAISSPAAAQRRK